MLLFLILLIGLPLLEITMLIVIGSHLGVLATLGLVIFTGFLGSALLRSQGVTALSKLRRDLEAGRAPNTQMADAAMIVVAGVMLIVPGFISDIIGILLFIPFVRQWIVRKLADKVTIHRAASNGQATVDLGEHEYHRTRNDTSGAQHSETTSPWRVPLDKQ